MKKLLFTFVVAILWNTQAQIPPTVLYITYSLTNSTASLMVSNIYGQSHSLVIETSTNLGSTNWLTFTNLGPGQLQPVLVFTNLPATNSQMFFRCKSN